jgi:RHS repeat-associated protein
MATISDKRIQHSSNGTTIDYYLPDVKSATDSYAFGSPMPGRTYQDTTSKSYRYGYNGKEKDNDLGSENYDYGFRIYGSREGKFLSVDPLTKKYPMLSPYQFASNNPINGIDLDGKEFLGAGWLVDKMADGFSALGMQRTAGFTSSYGHALMLDPLYSTVNTVQKINNGQYGEAAKDFDVTGVSRLPDIYHIGKSAYDGDAYAQGQALGMLPGLFGLYKTFTMAPKNAVTSTPEAAGADAQNSATNNSKPQGAANPVVKGAIDLGNKVHYDKLNGGTGEGLPTELSQKYPDTRFKFTPRGASGADVEYLGGTHPSQYPGSTWDPGNNFADFKPNTTSGTRSFNSAVNSGSFPANTQLLKYDPITGKLL